MSSFLPLRLVFSKRSKRPTPWFTPEIADKIIAKNKAKHVFERTRLESDKARYKKLKNNLKSTIRLQVLFRNAGIATKNNTTFNLQVFKHAFIQFLLPWYLICIYIAFLYACSYMYDCMYTYIFNDCKRKDMFGSHV